MISRTLNAVANCASEAFDSGGDANTTPLILDNIALCSFKLMMTSNCFTMASGKAPSATNTSGRLPNCETKLQIRKNDDIGEYKNINYLVISAKTFE